MKIGLKKTLLLPIAIGVFTLTPLVSFSQESAGITQLEEIVVTAQRKEQSLQDVPISITAFSAQTLDQNNMKGAADYLQSAPNVSFSESSAEGNKGLKIAIRGISDLQQSGERVSANSAFGIYVDEFSTATAARGTSNPTLYDVERVEVLRGPQGTYYGRNATGGAINITTKKPTDEFYGQVDLGIGSFGTLDVGGVVNLPVSDNFAVRTAILLENSDGEVENVGPGGGDSGYDNSFFRISSRWDPSEQLQVDFSATLTKEDDGMPNLVSRGILSRFGPNSQLDDPVITCGLAVDVFDKACRDTTGFTKLEDKTFNLRAKYEGDKIGVASVTGFIDTTMDQLGDLDGSGKVFVDRANNYSSESLSQEVRIFNTNPGAISWTVGGLAYDDELVAGNKIIIQDFLGPWLRGDNANENVITVNRDGWALFADVEWQINDSLTLAVGGRYSKDNDGQVWSDVFSACPHRSVGSSLSAGCSLRPDQSINGLAAYSNGSELRVSGGRAAQTLGTVASNDSTDFSPRVALNWKINDDWSMYGVVSQGYKAAGARANPDSGGANNSVFDKEKLTNIEVGFKAELNDGRTRLSGAIFDMKWDDFQTTVRETFCRESDGSLRPQVGSENCEFVPLDRIQNAEEAGSKGFEVTVDTLIGDNFRLGLAYGYLDAEYVSFQNAIVGGALTDLSGYSLPNAPQNTISASSEYSFQVGEADSYVRLEANYRDSVFNQDSIADPELAIAPITPDDYWVFNLRAGFEWENQRISFGVENLFEEDYSTSAGRGVAGILIRPHPRMLNLKWTIWTK